MFHIHTHAHTHTHTHRQNFDFNELFSSKNLIICLLKKISYNSFLYYFTYIHAKKMKKTQLSKSKSKLSFLVICSSKYRKGRIVKVKHVRKFNEQYSWGT